MKRYFHNNVVCHIISIDEKGTRMKKELLSSLKIFVVFMLLMVISACSRTNERMLNQLLEQDPEFKEILLLKREAANQITALKKQLLEHRREANSKITAIKELLRTQEKEIQIKIRTYEDKIRSKIQEINSRIIVLNAELKKYKRELKRIEQMIKDTRTIMEKSKTLGLISDDPSQWDRKFIELNEQKDNMQERINIIKDKIQMYKAELRFIR